MGSGEGKNHEHSPKTRTNLKALPNRETGTMALPSRLMGSSCGTHRYVPQRVTVKIVCAAGKKAQVPCVWGTPTYSFLLSTNEMETKMVPSRMLCME